MTRRGNKDYEKPYTLSTCAYKRQLSFLKMNTASEYCYTAYLPPKLNFTHTNLPNIMYISCATLQTNYCSRQDKIQTSYTIYPELKIIPYAQKYKYNITVIARRRTKHKTNKYIPYQLIQHPIPNRTLIPLELFYYHP